MRSKIESAFNVNFTDMFTCSGGETNGSLMDRRAFLVYHPQQHMEQIDVLTRWLLMHHVEVSNAWYEGSWDTFSNQILQGSTGIIIVSNTDDDSLPTLTCIRYTLMLSTSLSSHELAGS